jgi:hypothetical protein
MKSKLVDKTMNQRIIIANEELFQESQIKSPCLPRGLLLFYTERSRGIWGEFGMKKAIIILILMVVMAGAGWGAAPTPLRDFSYQMNIQGKVTGATAGMYDFTFTLKRSVIGYVPGWADAGWTETIAGVNIGSDGLFNLILGQTTSIPLFNPMYDYAIEITFAGTPMGRQYLVGVPLASVARNLWGGVADAKSEYAAIPALKGTNTHDNGFGVYGSADSGFGIGGTGIVGVWGHSQDRPLGEGILGTSNQGRGVLGMISPEGKSGILGMTTDSSIPTQTNVGVIGLSKSGYGVYGKANSTDTIYSYGGYFSSDSFYGRGVYGVASGTRAHGVSGRATGTYGIGLYGEATASNGQGVFGRSTTTTGSAIYAENKGPDSAVTSKADDGIALHIGDGKIKISGMAAGKVYFPETVNSMWVDNVYITSDSIVLITKNSSIRAPMQNDEVYYVAGKTAGSGFTIARNTNPTGGTYSGLAEIGYLIIN